MKLRYILPIVLLTSIIVMFLQFYGSLFLPMYVRNSVDGSTTITKKITDDYYYTSNSNGILKGNENGGIIVYDDGIDSLGSNESFILVFSKKKYILIRLNNRKIDSISYEVRFKDFNTLKLVDLSSFLKTSK